MYGYPLVMLSKECFVSILDKRQPLHHKTTLFHVFILHEVMAKYYVSNTVQRH